MLANRVMNIAQNGFGIIMRLLGPCLICLAVGLIGVVVRCFLLFLLPIVTVQFGLAWWCHFSWGMWLLFNILFNYMNAVFTSPGHPSDNYANAAPLEANGEVDPRAGGDFSTWCKTCNRAKPPRCHHCHICKQCVLSMDHHCPWMWNCVGHGNLRYFILFLFYMWVGCIYATAVSAYPFFKAVGTGRPALHGVSVSARSSIVFTFVICLSVGIAISCLFAWHLYLVFSAQTTIEFYHNRSRAARMRKLHGQTFVNEFDLGRTKNWQAVFGKGKYWFSWMLPSRRRPPGDGMSFPTISGLHIYTNEGHVV